jgi:hypothetical protein
MTEFSPNYGPFFQLTPLSTMVQEFILRVDVGEYGCVMGVEPATNAGVVLRFSQEEGGVVVACHQSPTGGNGLLLHEQPNHRAVRTHVRAVAGLRGDHRPLSVSTLKVETLLQFRGAVPELSGLVRGAGFLTGLAGQ